MRRQGRTRRRHGPGRLIAISGRSRGWQALNCWHGKQFSRWRYLHWRRRIGRIGRRGRSVPRRRERSRRDGRIPRQPPQFASSRGHRQGGNSVRQRTSQRSGFIRGRCCLTRVGRVPRHLGDGLRHRRQHMVRADLLHGSLGNTVALVQLCRRCSGGPPRPGRCPVLRQLLAVVGRFLDADGRTRWRRYGRRARQERGRRRSLARWDGWRLDLFCRVLRNGPCSIGDLALRDGGRPNGWRCSRGRIQRRSLQSRHRYRLGGWVCGRDRHGREDVLSAGCRLRRRNRCLIHWRIVCQGIRERHAELRHGNQRPLRAGRQRRDDLARLQCNGRLGRNGKAGLHRSHSLILLISKRHAMERRPLGNGQGVGQNAGGQQLPGRLCLGSATRDGNSGETCGIRHPEHWHGCCEAVRGRLTAAVFAGAI